MSKPQAKRLGFFTRVLDEVGPAERYRMATDQIVAAEANGFDSAWIAQHHFHEFEGGMPSPFVFLNYVAAKTSTIRLGTAIITLPLENAIRVAEDAIVLDTMSGGRFEFGVGTGGTPSSFVSFGLVSDQRATIFAENYKTVRDAWSGEAFAGGDRLYPDGRPLLDRCWQATFSAGGGARAGTFGDGLMLSKTQPRPKDNPKATLSEMQHPIIDAYLENLPEGRAPRIMGSRTLFVADNYELAMRYAEEGIARHLERNPGMRPSAGSTLAEWIPNMDICVGTPESVLEDLKADTALERTTEMVFQVHPIEPPHEAILRSIELIAEKVAPALGWAGPANAKRSAAE